MATRLTYLGAAGFDIEGPEHRILIDPFLSENPAAPMSHDELEAPDVILVSHAAFDHYGDTAAIAKRTGAPVVCDAAVTAMLVDEGVPRDQIQAMAGSVTITAGTGAMPSTRTIAAIAPAKGTPATRRASPTTSSAIRARSARRPS